MTPEQTKQLLAKAALTDNRTMDLVSIRAWHEIIGRLDFQDAMDALTMHRRESAEYLQPAHIVTNARRSKAARETESNRQRALTAAPVAPDLTEANIRQRIMDTPEFRAAFERGRLEGNAERAYWTTIRETGDRTKAAAASNAARMARRDAR